MEEVKQNAVASAQRVCLVITDQADNLRREGVAMPAWADVATVMSAEQLDDFAWHHRRNLLYGSTSCVAFLLLGGR